MPNRIIKDSICTSASVNELSAFEETFFVRLIVNVDDFGRFDARPAILKSRLFPLKAITEKQISGALRKLSTLNIVNLYEVDGKPYVMFVNWKQHQSIRAARSKYPAPQQMNADEINCMQMNTDDFNCNQMNADEINCARNPIRNPNPNPIRNPNRNPNTHACARENGCVFYKPTVDEIRSYCQEHNISIDANEFYDHYEANGWTIGKSPMKDWKAALRGWERRRKESSTNTGRCEPTYDKSKIEQILNAEMMADLDDLED